MPTICQMEVKSPSAYACTSSRTAISEAPHPAPWQSVQCPGSSDPPTSPGGSLGHTRDSGALAASRRPFRVRTFEGPNRVGRSTRGRSTDLPRDEPPPGACSKRRGAGPLRLGRALRLAGGLRGRAGKRRDDGLLGRRHVLPRRGEKPALVVWRVLLQVRRVHSGGAVPRRPRDPGLRARYLPAADRQPGRGRVLPHPQRDLDRRAGSCAATPRRPTEPWQKASSSSTRPRLRAGSGSRPANSTRTTSLRRSASGPRAGSGSRSCPRRRSSVWSVSPRRGGSCPHSWT